MKTIKYMILCVTPILLLFLVFGCQQDLAVTNLNAPDAERALARANDIEKLAGGAGNQWWRSQSYY